MMVETIEKATLIEKLQSAYEQLNTLLAPLGEEQKMTPGVNFVAGLKLNKSSPTVSNCVRATLRVNPILTVTSNMRESETICVYLSRR